MATTFALLGATGKRHPLRLEPHGLPDRERQRGGDRVGPARGSGLSHQPPWIVYVTAIARADQTSREIPYSGPGAAFRPVWGDRVPVWATPPGRSTHPSSSCTSGTARRCCRCRTAHRQQPAARRGRRSGRWLDGLDARSQGTNAVLATPGAQDAGAETLPGPGAVQGVVAAAVGCSGVDRAATTRAAGHNSADRAQLHCSRRPSAVPRLTVVTLEYTPADIVMSVEREGAAVYSPRVLSPRHQRLRR